MPRQPFVNKPLATATVAAPKKTKDAQVYLPKSSKKPFGASGTKSTTPLPTLGKRQKPLSMNLFDEDDEEDDRMAAPPKKPLLKLDEEPPVISNVQKTQEENQNEEEEDPLDAFMTGIEKAPIQSENKGTRGDIEDEDEMDNFVIQRENELRNQPELFDEMEDYDSGAEDYLDNIRADHIVGYHLKFE